MDFWDKIFKLTGKQISNNRFLLGGIFGISFLLIIALVLISYTTGISINEFTRDPIALAEISFYSGFFSQLGNILWFFAAGMTLIAYYTCPSKYKKFLFFSTLFSLMLGIDDLFLIHDGFLPAFGINDNWMYVIYGVFTAYYFIFFFQKILKTPFIFLLLAFSFFGLSILFDLIKVPGIHPYIFEDGFKMAGILSWVVYYYRTSVLLIQKTMIKNENQLLSRVSENMEMNNLKKVSGE